MGQSGVDEFKVRVAAGEGHLLGDFLRKFVMRGVPTWQVAGYKIDSKTPNFGLSNGGMSSYLVLQRGRIVSLEEQHTTDPKIVHFTWNGTCFAAPGFELHEVNKSVGDSVTACLVYGRGSRSAAQNLEVCREATSGDADDYFVVPSSHSKVRVFKFDVEPIDDRCEWLKIFADSGVVSDAYQNAVTSLQGLSL